MNNIIARVVAQSQPVNVVTKSGDMAKRFVRLKEIGGEFADEFLAVILGPLATIDLAEGQLVSASIRFHIHENNGNTYQDVTIRDIVKL